MNSISRNVHIDKLDDIVNKYNNTYHSTMKMKPADVKSNTYIDLILIIKILNLILAILLELNRYKNIFAKRYAPNRSEDSFVIKKVKNTMSWTYVIKDLHAKEIVGKFYQKELQKANRKEFKIEKVIKRKGVELYVKWKGHNRLLSSYATKADLIS